MRLTLHQYQRAAVDFMLRNPRAAICLDTGLGKTATTLSFIQSLRTIDEGSPVLIIGPLRVILKTWSDEVEQWSRFKDLRLSILHGPKKAERLAAPADIYLINAEGLPWLKNQKDLPAFKSLVVDESTKFKTWTSARTRALRKILDRFERRYILTATPAPNASKNIDQIFAQWSLLDDRLGPTLTAFRREFCHRGGFENREWRPNEGSIEHIAEKIRPITLHQSKLEELDMPPLIYNDIKVDLPAKCRETYKQFEADLYTVLADETQLLAFAGSQRYIKCRQLANGSTYVDGVSHWVHDEKVDALESLVESLLGKPVLVLYQYKQDLAAIENRFGELPVINGSTTSKQTGEIVDAWNSGGVPILLGQSSALSHGLNLQKSGASDVCWFSLCDCSEIFSQSIDRIWRQGCRGPVKVHRILTRGTIDVVLARTLEKKAAVQSRFLEGLKDGR